VTIATGEEDTLGYVIQAMKKNRYVTTDEELRDDICVLMGGREAERLCLGKVSSGAHNDLQRANEIARVMVEELGMSPRIGPRTFGQSGSEWPNGNGPGRRPMGERTAQLVDDAIRDLLDEQQQRAQTLLEQYRAQLDSMVELLIARKTLGLPDLQTLLPNVPTKA
jgi:cell division protease FtsH